MATVRLRGLSDDSLRRVVEQADHGLAVGQFVRAAAAGYVAASPTLEAGEIVGLVERVSGDRFVIAMPGAVTTAVDADPGQVYFLGVGGAFEATKAEGVVVSAPILRGLPGGSALVLGWRPSEDEREAFMAIIPAPSDQGGITETEAGFLSAEIASVAHGFVDGDVLRYDTSEEEWVKAQADSAANAGSGDNLGFCEKVGDDAFKVRTGGLMNLPAHTETVGAEIYLSASVAGEYVTTAPSTQGYVVQRLGIVEDSNNFRVDIDNGYVVQ